MSSRWVRVRRLYLRDHAQVRNPGEEVTPKQIFAFAPECALPWGFHHQGMEVGAPWCCFPGHPNHLLICRTSPPLSLLLLRGTTGPQCPVLRWERASRVMAALWGRSRLLLEGSSRTLHCLAIGAAAPVSSGRQSQTREKRKTSKLLSRSSTSAETRKKNLLHVKEEAAEGVFCRVGVWV